MVFVLNNERIILSALLGDMQFPEECILRKNFGKCQGNNSTGIILRPSPNLQTHTSGQATDQELGLRSCAA